MTKLQINAGQDHIAKYVSANPIITGITELIWNSLDANATTINIVTRNNGLNGFEYIDIIDDGHGCTYMQAKNAFQYIGNSYKRNRDKTKDNNRNIFILFNPSIANANVLDETLKNCVRICYALQNYSDEKVKCGGMLIYNSFTIRHPQVEDAVRMIDWEYEYANNPIFQLADKYPINVSKIIIAWGNDVKTKLNNEYYSHLKDLVSSIKSKKHLVQAYRINKSGAKQPSHPSPRCTSLVKKFCANPKLVEVENL